MVRDLRDDAVSVWRAAVAAVDPRELVEESLLVTGHCLAAGNAAFDLNGIGRIAVVGAGKAGRGMAEGVESALGEEVMKAKDLTGWVNVLKPHAGRLTRIVLHGSRSPGSPQPTSAGVAGTKRMIKILESLGPSDLAICLLSGGGSAMMTDPPRDVPLGAKKAVAKLLSEKGATIGELNTVRKHVSNVKGGRLAERCRAGTLIALIISDVVGDDLEVIASGPTVSDRSTFENALSILNGIGSADLIPREILDHITKGVRGEIPDSPKQLGRGVHNILVGNNRAALAAAEMKSRALGYNVLCLGSFMEGEARQIGIALGSLALSIRKTGRPVAPPACVLWGGETTVSSVVSGGKGGRNQELALGALDRFFDSGMEGFLVFSASTDGEDGPTDAAGGFADGFTLAGSRSAGLVPRSFLERSDSYHFLKRAGGLFISGPTGTNVMDVSLALVP
jgi:glycerate 2-kinase